jgi:hypothetical protein
MYRDFPTMNRVFVNLPNMPSPEFPHHPLNTPASTNISLTFTGA